MEKYRKEKGKERKKEKRKIPSRSEEKADSVTLLGWELLKDPAGRDHFLSFLEREYATGTQLYTCTLQIHFTCACQKYSTEHLYASGT